MPARSQPPSTPTLDPRHWARLVFIALAGTVIFVSTYLQVRGTAKRHLQDETTLMAQQVQIRLAAWISTRVKAVEAFSLTQDTTNDPVPEVFRRQAQSVIDQHPGFQALNWVDAKGVIRITVPNSGNEGARGKNLFEHGHASVAAALHRANSTSVFTRSDPLDLLQGLRGLGSYLAIRAPDGTLRGYINAVFRLDKLVDTCLSDPRLRKQYRYALHEPNGGAQAYPSSGEDRPDADTSAWPHVRTINVGAWDKPWTLSFAPSRAHVKARGTWADELILLAGLLGTAVLVLLVWSRMRRRATEGVREARYRSLITDVLDASRVGIIVTDAGGRIVWLNRAQESFFGVGRNPLVGRKIGAVIRLYGRLGVVEDGPAIAGEFRADAGSDAGAGTCHVMPGDGRLERWLEHRSAPVGQGLFAGGRIDHFHDVTRRRAAESEQSRLAAAIDQSSEMVWIVDGGGRMCYVNPVLEQVTGYTRDEALGRVPRLLESGPQTMEVWATIRAGETWRGQYGATRPDGSSFHADAAVSPVRNSEGVITHFVGVIRDVTRETALEEQLRQAQKMEAVGKLAGGVAHDFNNILQVIMGRGHLALSKALRGVADTDTIKEIIDASERAADLTRQLLAFGRRQVLRRTVLAPNQLVSDHLRMLRRLIGEDIELQVSLSDAMENVRADKTQLEQVLMNLCVNAREAMPAGGTVTITTSMAHRDGNRLVPVVPGSANGTADHAVIEVRDTGQGIAPENLTRVFDPFFSTKEPGKGSGLGLSTVYGIVKQHEGLAQIDSRPGEGTRIRIGLPCVQDAVEGPKSDEHPDQDAVRGSECVLVVEDDEMVRNLAVTVLTDAGFQVVTAEDGQEALDILRARPSDIDLVFSDVVMPRLGGQALAEALSSTGSRARVLLTSGYRKGHMRTAAAIQFPTLAKPYGPAKMLTRVREVLDAPIATPIS